MRRSTRLNPTDEMLAESASTLGSARMVQVLWQLPRMPDAAAVRAQWRRLDGGLLSRAAHRSAVPGGRRRWVHAGNAEPPRIADRSPDAGAAAWVDDQVRAPLDDGDGRLWRLSVTACGSGALVSLVVPHHRADGLGLLNALDSATPDDPPLPWALRVADDAAEAASGIVRAGGGLARARVRERLRTAVRAGPDPAPPPAGEPQFFSWAVLDVDAAHWAARAQRAGGTTNSLFLEIAANLVRSRVPGVADTVDVGVPMSVRDGVRDGRANALVVVPVTVPRGAPRHGDLGPVREASRRALAGSPSGVVMVPEPLWHLLPRRHRGRLRRPGAQQTDVVASNFGVVAPRATRACGVPARRVAVRTMNVPGLVAERARLRASLCLTENDGRLALTVTGMPAHVGDADELAAVATDELTRWGLTARRWL